MHSCVCILAPVPVVAHVSSCICIAVHVYMCICMSSCVCIQVYMSCMYGYRHEQLQVVDLEKKSYKDPLFG